MEKKDLPNASAVLVLGILSIFTCCCFGLIGLTLGIIALVLAHNSYKIYNTVPNPNAWSNYDDLKVGNICAIIGTILSVLFLIFVFGGIALVGVDVIKEIMETMEESIEY